MFTLNCKGRLLLIGEPLVMGIINCTPDSFYAGSRKGSADELLSTAGKMISEGADLIDVGGQSTRPGSDVISETEELDRVIPAVELIHARYPDALISIDTYYAGVARAAVHAGASMINDISAGSVDPLMITEAAKLGVPYVLSHIKGTPATMQQHAAYQQLMPEIMEHFTQKLREVREAGITDVILDPGFGFAKTISHNFHVLKQLRDLALFGLPILAGISRKATVYKTLGIDAGAALNGSTVLHTIALMNGANILRVHDVREAKEAVKLFTVYSKT